MTFTDITPPTPSTSIANAAMNPTLSSYIHSGDGHYWFELIPESCLVTKNKYINWLESITISIYLGWEAHCREEITMEQYTAFAAAANTWINKYDAKFKDE